MNAPLVTVVIPSHNRPEMLEEALESVVQQTLSNWEAIVVDDGSRPPVAFDRLQQRFGPRLRGIRHDVSRGGPAAKNAGVRSAHGQFLAHLDDDDLYHPEYLDSAANVLREFSDVDVVFMGVSCFGARASSSQSVYARAMERTLSRAKGTEVRPGLIIFGDPLVEALLRSVPMAFQRPVARRSAIDHIGLYREHCFLWDCDWAIRAAVTRRTALLTQPLYRQRTGDQGYSTTHKRIHDAALSGIEIMETLVARANAEPELRKWEDAFREAAARGFLDLAYFHQARREWRDAWQAWLCSQRRQLSPKRFTFLLRLVASALAIPKRTSQSRA